MLYDIPERAGQNAGVFAQPGSERVLGIICFGKIHDLYV